MSVGGSGVEDQAAPFHILVSALEPDTKVRLAVHGKAEEEEAIRVVQHREEFQELGVRSED